MSAELPQVLKGTTRQYAGNGRKLGYPTANMSVPTKLTDGVYFGFANIGAYAHHPALIFIGTPTTVGDTERRVEAHLLDIKDEDLYGLEMQLELRHYHRGNETFESVEKLLEVMKADEAAGRAWFKAKGK